MDNDKIVNIFIYKSPNVKITFFFSFHQVQALSASSKRHCRLDTVQNKNRSQMGAFTLVIVYRIASCVFLTSGMSEASFCPRGSMMLSRQDGTAHM